MTSSAPMTVAYGGETLMRLLRGETEVARADRDGVSGGAVLLGGGQRLSIVPCGRGPCLAFCPADDVDHPVGWARGVGAFESARITLAPDRVHKLVDRPPWGARFTRSWWLRGPDGAKLARVTHPPRKRFTIEPLAGMRHAGDREILLAVLAAYLALVAAREHTYAPASAGGG